MYTACVQVVCQTINTALEVSASSQNRHDLLLAMTRFKEANVDPSTSHHYHASDVDNLLPLQRLLQHPSFQTDGPVILAALSVRFRSV
jgi:hypothetical protein